MTDKAVSGDNVIEISHNPLAVHKSMEHRGSQ